MQWHFILAGGCLPQAVRGAAKSTLSGLAYTLSTVNSGELRIPYPVPVCVMGNLWLVKFNGFILQLMAKTNHKFIAHANRNGIRNSEFS